MYAGSELHAGIVPVAAARVEMSTRADRLGDIVRGERSPDPTEDDHGMLRRRKWMEQVYARFTPEQRLPVDERVEVFRRGAGA